MTRRRYPIRNRLLRALDESIFDSLRGKLEVVDLDAGTLLLEPAQHIRTVYFIDTGMASTLCRTLDGRMVELLQTGCEGMVGTAALLGATVSAHAVIMQMPGCAIKTPVGALMEAIGTYPEAQLLFKHYAYYCELQLSEFALACLSSRLNVRVARWLLMAGDRLQSDDLPVTHEFIASSLGVRRAGVTNELHILEGMHAIRATRGNIELLQPDYLREIAGGSYGPSEEEYRRLISAFGQTQREIDAG